MKTKGIIALDIDGTITEEFHTVPREVSAYLHSLAVSGWTLAFITGRPYKWGSATLKSFSFPYILAVQNGAIVLEMPSKKILSKKYLSKSITTVMDEICSNEPTDYIIYAGYESGDVCYYRPSRFSAKLSDYLKKRIVALEEIYHAVPSYSQLSLDTFPSVKCFGCPEDAARIAKKMDKALGLHVDPVRDPYDNNFMVAQATHAEATKGRAIKGIKNLFDRSPPVIAAGNDYNDVSMFSVCDIKVVMGNAPADLLEMADIVAPPVSEMGIIAGLQKAISQM